jgi:hypothetical protein
MSFRNNDSNSLDNPGPWQGSVHSSLMGWSDGTDPQTASLALDALGLD